MTTPTIPMKPTLLNPLPAGIMLTKGGHHSPEQGLCLLEAAAAVSGLPHSDHPPCVCEVLGNFGRSLNDCLPDESRQRLIPLIPRMLDTAGDGRSQERRLMAVRWIITVYTPAWLDLAGIEHGLAGLVINNWDDVELATPILRVAQEKADAAWAAAWAAAWDAARDANNNLAPIVARVQDSAIEVLEAMCTPLPEEPGA